jgi:hypothetical protein
MVGTWQGTQHRDAWQYKIPNDSPDPPFDRQVCQLVYHPPERAALDVFARKQTDTSWQRYVDRWAVIRDHQRRYVLAHPWLVPDRMERQRWLSRLLAGLCCNRVGRRRERSLIAGSEREEQARLDRLGQYGPRRHEAHLTRDRSREVGEAVAQVLDQRVAAGQRGSRAGLLEATHRIQALLEMPVVALDPIVEVARAPMFNVG